MADNLKKYRFRGTPKDQEAFYHFMEGCIKYITSELNLKNYQHDNLIHFQLAKSLQYRTSHTSFKSASPLLPLQVSLIEYYSYLRDGREISSGYDYYFIGLLTLRENYPHTIIYPETLTEKISELFVKVELDFKQHRRFSRTFYTLSEEKQTLNTLLQNKPLNDLAKFKEMELEIVNNTCYFRHSRKPVSQKEAGSFCELAKELNRVLN